MFIRQQVVAWALAVLALAAAGNVTSAQAQPPERWTLLARHDVDLAKGTASIDLTGARGLFKAIRLEVDAAPIVLTRVQVVYKGAAPHTEDRRIDLKVGERTRPIGSRDQGREIERIELAFDKVPGASVRPSIAVSGLSSAADVIAGAAGARPAAAQSQPPVATTSAAPTSATAARATDEPPPASTRGGSRRPAVATDTAVPEFPWPPPKASGRVEITRQLLVPASESSPTLGQVARRLQDALARAGYGDQSFYRIKDNGIALVTRMERMLSDGRSDPDPRQRFRPLGEREPFTLTKFVSSLLFSQPGNYRVIVFTMSSELLPASRDRITGKQASGLVEAGAASLPRWLADLPYTPDHTTFALIYEFEKNKPDANPILLDPSRLSALQHLDKAAIWPALQPSPTPATKRTRP